MNDAEFESKLAPILRQLEPSSGDCPSIDQIMAHREGKLTREERETFLDHAADCEMCLELLERLALESADVNDLSWRQVEKSLDSRTAPWKEEKTRTWLPPIPSLQVLAAGVLLVAAGLGVWMNWPAGGQQVSITRGPVIQMVQPVGPVDQVSHFQWSSPPVADRFLVTVRGLDSPLVVETKFSRLPLPPALRQRLVPGRSYSWRVEALDEAGATIVESDWVEFRVNAP